MAIVVMLSSCDDGLEHYEGVYITGAEHANPIISVSLDENMPKKVELVVASSEKVANDISIELEVDESLVEIYNKKFQAKYTMLPSDCFILTHPVATITEGNFATTEPVQLVMISTEGMVEGRRYIVPVKIKRTNNYDIIEGSDVVYVKIDQQISTFALNLGSKYINLNFHEENTESEYNPKALKEVSFEARVYINSYGQFNTIFGLEENLVVRTSTYGSSKGELEVAGGGMTNLVAPNPFPVKKWTHVALTYNTISKYCALYIDGETVASGTITRKEGFDGPINITYAYEGGDWREGPMFIGRSAGSRPLNGAISELRVWARELTQAEIKSNMCAVDPTEPGILGYWKLNENESISTFTESAGTGYTATLSSGTAAWTGKIKCPE